LRGGVEYENGTEAAGSSVYLHHAALLNLGPQAKDGTCGRPAYDLFFSTGNERSNIIYNNPNSTTPAGYYIQPSDNFLLQSEIVNNEQHESPVWVVMKFEYIPGKPADQQQTKVVWLSAGGPGACSRKLDLSALLGAVNGTGEPKLGAGELYPPNDKKFTLKSEPWVSPWTGNFVALGGHIHDGGVNTEIYQNGKLICDSRAKYATGMSHGMAAGQGSADARHISSMSGCRSTEPVKAGDKFEIVVNYDFDTYPGMKGKDDKLLPIMAAATLFIGASNQ